MAYFICSQCGFGSASWIGRCPDCNQWNTLKERSDLVDDNQKKGKKDAQKFSFKPLSSISSKVRNRIKTGVFEFDRVLGGGIVPGEVILLTGEPGIGKSTLLLQSLQKAHTLYVSGEESAEQVKNRADRLKIDTQRILFSSTLQVESIIEGASSQDKDNPIELLVIDSVQTIYSRNQDGIPGSVGQLKSTSEQLIRFAKEKLIPIILVGHVTKGGDIAGPKTLEHMVDCVLSFEGETVSELRILRALKNRFGTTEEIGIFEMKENGMTEISLSTVFLKHENSPGIGKAIAGISEGKRTLFFEIQTLAVSTVLAVPRRVVNGVDYNKVQLILAVMRKYLGLRLDSYDIYVNVVGGMNVKSTAADLAIAASIYSSCTNIPLPSKTLFCGEVGLLGEIHEVPSETKIIQEARRLKFLHVYSSKNIQNLQNLKKIIIPS